MASEPPKPALQLPPPLPGRIAGGIVLPCGKRSSRPSIGAPGSPPGVINPLQQPCDVAAITLSLELPNTQTCLTLTNSSKRAREQELGDVPKDVSDLLKAHAVLYYREGPAAALGSAPSATRSTGPVQADEIRAKASIVPQMQARCGDHPEFSNSKWKEGSTAPKTEADLSISTRGWDPKDILACLWGDGKIVDLWSAQSDSCTFEVSSCGRPAGGDPLTRLSAHVRLVQADEWIVDARFPAGFVIDFTHSRSTTLLAEGKEDRIVSRSSKSQGSVQSESESTTYYRGKSVQYREVDGRIYDPGKRGLSLEADSARYEADRKALSESAADKFKKSSEAAAAIANKNGIGLSVKRNGKEMLDAASWTENIDTFLSVTKSIDLIFYRLLWMVENGLNFGAPVQGKFEYAVLVRLLQGSIGFRLWPEQAKLVQSGTYYVETCKRRWQAAIAVTPALADITVKGTVVAKFIHEWLASVSGSLEFKATGSDRIEANYSCDDGFTSKPYTTTVRMSVKLAVSGTMASYYLSAEGEVAGAIEHVVTIDADNTGILSEHHVVDNGPITLQVIGKRGNKIFEFFSLTDRSAKKWNWPEDGPLVLVKPHALRNEWRNSGRPSY